MIKKLLKDYEGVNDLIKNKINNFDVFYLESLVDQNKVDEFILEQLCNQNKFISAPNTKEIKKYDDLMLYLNSGFTIVFSKNKVYAVETKANLTKAIQEGRIESSLIGPKDSLTENYQLNLGLIKRRIKSSHLKEQVLNIGKYTNTTLSILSIDNIVNNDLVLKVKEKLNKIDIDGINDINELKVYLSDSKNTFPAFKVSERPDALVNALLAGKIVILLDTSPYGLIIPSFLVDFINPIDDQYLKSININFTKILRLLCFILSIITPALYIALTTFNQETIPTSLLLSFQNQRINVPFPALIESIITLIICEILRESDIRFPSNYGSAISILGALVLGEAAVSAGLVSEIMIITIAITFISSLIFTDTEIINATRTWRFIFLFSASLYGLFGVCLTTILFIINLSSYEVLSYPYLFPINPFDMSYIKETIIKMKNDKRSKILSKNIYKGDL